MARKVRLTSEKIKTSGPPTPMPNTTLVSLFPRILLDQLHPTNSP